MEKFSFYAHGGSQNHGCEAIARTSANMLGGGVTLYSQSPEEDLAYGLDALMKVEKCGDRVRRYSPRHIAYKLWSYVGGMDARYRYEYRRFLENASGLCLSIGGDNYCYDYQWLLAVNRAVAAQGGKTVLWACSIEPDALKDGALLADLQSYSLITARESLTYEALLAAGIEKHTRLFPDPAFTLATARALLPEGFHDGNTVGVNLSPLIMSCETKEGAAFRNFEALIEHILRTSDMQVALIPHVVWAYNDDRKPLRALYERFADTGRVVLIGDAGAEELKGVIARCRFFIGARTHATIAAYSSCVPTLVVGYSVKAKGIAKDLFGTYKRYVLPVQSLSREEELTEAFTWLTEQEKEIRAHLQTLMPEYVARAYGAAEEVKKLYER
ncbi:MAG: hypothetical protein DBY36_06535 [Clostridiales bacterium]|nr:MAG: hypothetical protein DBY36_06535 [Clostridiales bacterium]